MPEKTSNKIEEMLRQLAGNVLKSSPRTSSEGLSTLRQKSLMIFQKLDIPSDKYVKHQYMKQIVMKFIRPHITNVITNEIPEAELKAIMKQIYLLLKEDFDEFAVANLLKNDTLNSPEMTKKLMAMPQFAKISELL